jgi:hypothetical protein
VSYSRNAQKSGAGDARLALRFSKVKPAGAKNTPAGVTGHISCND